LCRTNSHHVKKESERTSLRFEYLTKAVMISRGFNDAREQVEAEVAKLKESFRLLTLGKLDSYFLSHENYIKLAKDVQHLLGDRELLSASGAGSLQLTYNSAKVSIFEDFHRISSLPQLQLIQCL
jgi:hypothetical protein